MTRVENRHRAIETAYRGSSRIYGAIEERALFLVGGSHEDLVGG
jgi:hypothetical protein